MGDKRDGERSMNVGKGGGAAGHKKNLLKFEKKNLNPGIQRKIGFNQLSHVAEGSTNSSLRFVVKS